MWLLLILSNPTSDPKAAPSRVWVSAAAGGAQKDELLAGHSTAKGFFEQYLSHAGYWLDLSTGNPIQVLATRIPPHQVASGLAQMAVVRGGPLEVQLEAQFPRENQPPTLSRALPVDNVHQRGVFGAPFIPLTFSYTVDGPVAMMVIGDQPDLLRDEASGAPLAGNYGVIYAFDVQLTNPTAATFRAVLAMHAVGGPAGGTFLVNGVPFDVPAVLPNAPRIVMTLPVPAGGGAHLHISTISEPGASYPLLITVGPPP
jgi:hypothetical protein